MARDNKIVVIWVLAILLVLVLSYVGFSIYQNAKYQEQLTIYNEGYNRAKFDLMQSAATCQTVPVTLGNQTLNVVAVECLTAEQPSA